MTNYVLFDIKMYQAYPTKTYLTVPFKWEEFIIGFARHKKVLRTLPAWPLKLETDLNMGCKEIMYLYILFIYIYM